MNDTCATHGLESHGGAPEGYIKGGAMTVEDERGPGRAVARNLTC